MRIRYTAKTKTIFWLAQLQASGKIYLDRSFQSRARWGTKEKQKYLTSCIEGFNLSPVTIAHIGALLIDVKENEGEECEDAIFFQKLLDQGYEFITVDGNNRDETLAQFFTSEVKEDYSLPLTQKKYDLGDRELSATKTCKYFAQFGKEEQEFFKNIPIQIHFIKEGGRKALRKAFRCVNDGMKLNDQELRNADSCIFADLVRDLVDDCLPGFEKLYTAAKINRRHPDEFIVDVAILNAQGLVMINPTARDLAYGDNTKEKTQFQKTKRIITQITDITKKWGKTGLNVEKKLKGTLYDLVMLLRHINNNKIRIDNLEGFYNFFIKTQSARVKDPKIIWNSQKGNDPRAYAGLLKNLQPEFLQIRESILIESLKDIDEGILTYLDPVRNFSPTMRFTLWKRQGGKCAITGEPISPIEVCNGNITHIDHEKPYTLGGPTTLENARLVFKGANLSKGAKFDPNLDLEDNVIDDEFDVA